ncbi:hypothetical protein Dimus_026894 [Dionaea muscipula]
MKEIQGKSNSPFRVPNSLDDKPPFLFAVAFLPSSKISFLLDRSQNSKRLGFVSPRLPSLPSRRQASLVVRCCLSSSSELKGIQGATMVELWSRERERSSEIRF